MTLFYIGHYTTRRIDLTSTRSGGGAGGAKLLTIQMTPCYNPARLMPMLFTAILFALAPCLTSPVERQMTFTDLKSLRESLWSDAAKDTRFDVTGFVAFVCDGKTTRIDLVEGESHHQFWFSTTADCPVRSGDLARLRGHLGPSPENIRREITSPLAPYVDRADSLGKAPVRHYDEISGVRLICGDFTNASVSVRGVVSGAHRDELNANWNWFILRTQTAKVFVATPDRENSLESLKGLADAEVTVCGSAMPSPRLKGLSRFQLLVVGDRGIVCTKRPPADPYALPDLADGIRRMVDPNPREPVSMHRSLIHGIVLGRGNGRLFVRTSGDVFCSVVPLSAHPEIGPGCRISAAGFFEYELSGIAFTDAHVRLDSPDRAPLPSGKPIDARTLSPESKGNQPFNATCYGEAVTICGTVANSAESVRHDGIIRLICGDHAISVDVRSTNDGIPLPVEKGYGLSVTGIPFGEQTSNRTTGDFPVFTGFTIYPRVPEDIVVVSRPSWWTPTRLMGVILALTVLIVAILIWNRSLAVLSDRRGKRLYAEAIAHTKAEMKVEERTHLAVELHDALSQNLSGVSLQLDAVRRFASENADKMLRHLDFAARTLKSCRAELRNCLWDLRNHALDDADMNEAIRKSVSPFTGEAKLVIRFYVPRDSISDDTAHALIRIIRELASNAVTHGAAKTIRIAGALEDGLLHISVRDDGSGFDTHNHPGTAEGHFGLDGIRERVSRLDGTFEITSSPVKGTSALITLIA